MGALAVASLPRSRLPPCGTPVIDEYGAKMPFKFTGVLKKV
jgi:hypothetical protein